MYVIVEDTPKDLSRHSWSPATTGPPGPFATNYVAVDGPPLANRPLKVDKNARLEYWQNEVTV